MKVKLLAALTALCMVLLALPAASLALEKTPTPRLSRDSAVYASENSSYKPAFLVYSTGAPYTAATLAVYDTADATQVSQSATIESLSGVYSIALTDGNPVQEVTVCIGVTEPGKDESVRVPFTIQPYSEEGYVREMLSRPDADQWTFGCSETEGDTESKARAELLEKINKNIEDNGFTWTLAADDMELNANMGVPYYPARFGLSGALNVTLSIGGKSIDVNMYIAPGPYAGGKYFEMDPGNALSASFLATDADDATKELKLTIFGTKLWQELAELDKFNSIRFSFSGNKDDPRVAVSGITLDMPRLYSMPSTCLTMNITKPTVVVDDAPIHLWYSYSSDGGNPVYIGKFTVSAGLYSARTPAPQFTYNALAYSARDVLVLGNASALAGATYSVYITENADGTGEYVACSTKIASQSGDILSIGETGVQTGGDTFYWGVTATLPGQAESEMAYYTSTLASAVLAGALTTDTSAEVLAYGEVENYTGTIADPASLEVDPVTEGDNGYDSLIAAAKEKSGSDDILGAYEISIEKAEIKSTMTVRFYVGAQYAGRYVAVLHRNSETGKDDVNVCRVGADGYVNTSVTSFSPFALSLTNASDPDPEPVKDAVIAAPQTGSGALLGLYAVMLAALAFAAACSARRKRG